MGHGVWGIRTGTNAIEYVCVRGAERGGETINKGEKKNHQGRSKRGGRTKGGNPGGGGTGETG